MSEARRSREANKKHEIAKTMSELCPPKPVTNKLTAQERKQREQRLKKKAEAKKAKVPDPMKCKHCKKRYKSEYWLRKHEESCTFSGLKVRPGTGRKKDGTFSKGNQHSKKGSPDRMKLMKKELQSVLTPGNYRKIFKKLLQMSLKGSTKAIKILLEYDVGKPVQPIESLDLDVLFENSRNAIQILQNEGIK